MAIVFVERANTPSVTIDLRDNDFLLYKMTVRGSRPIFTVEDSRAVRTIFSDEDEPATTEPLLYERRWPIQGDIISTVTNHVAGISFLAAIAYTYQVECHRGNGTVEELKDIDLTSSAPEDKTFIRLGVNVKF